MPTELETAFTAAGLPLPPIPADLGAELQPRGEWLFGTQQPDAPLYDLDHFLKRALHKPDEDFLLIGQSGYGVNNWHLHYFLSRGPLALFVQTPWGGAFHDEDETCADIASHFEQIDRMLTISGGFTSARPRKRLVIVHSEIGESRWGWFSDQPTDTIDPLVWEIDESPIEAALAAIDSQTA